MGLPLPTIFCRAPIFITSSSSTDIKSRRDCISVDKRERSVIFTDNIYRIAISGSFVDHRIDLPLFMVIVQEAINTLPPKAKRLPDEFEVGLDRLICLLKRKKLNKKEAFSPITRSLDRLSRLHLNIVERESKKVLCDGVLLKRHSKHKEWLDYDNKVINIGFSQNLQNLYPFNSNERRITFIDLPAMLCLKNGLSRSILKYYASHDQHFTDVTEKALYRITGIDKLSSPDDKNRERVKDSLKELEKTEYLADFKYLKKLKRFRCCRADYYPKGTIEYIDKSNLDTFERYLTKEQKLANRQEILKKHNLSYDPKSDEEEPPDYFEFGSDIPFE
jgi:hypothetical protein